MNRPIRLLFTVDSIIYGLAAHDRGKPAGKVGLTLRLCDEKEDPAKKYPAGAAAIIREPVQLVRRQADRYEIEYRDGKRMVIMGEPAKALGMGRFTFPMYMPDDCARISATIRKAEARPLQSLTDDEVRLTGVEPLTLAGYRKVWDAMHAKDAEGAAKFGWEANPRVAFIHFDVTAVKEQKPRA